MNLTICFKNGSKAIIYNYKEVKYMGTTIKDISEIVFEEPSMYGFYGESVVMTPGSEILFVQLEPQ